MFGSKPKLPTSLRIFGEIIENDIIGNLKNRGLTRMFVGYSIDQTSYFYQMLKMNSKKIFQKCCDESRKNNSASNYNDKYQDIKDSTEECVTLNP
jgi:hypothetical protein